MNILSIDAAENSLDFCLRSQDVGHDVRLWTPKNKAGEESPVGRGLVDKVPDWRKLMDWAELILLVDNATYRDDLQPFFDKGYPIFGCNKACGELELDRGKGQDLMESCGLTIPEYQVFSKYDEAIAYVKETNKAYVSKPWGGNQDKSLSYVGRTPADLVFRLQKWKEEGRKGEFMLQEVISGVEVAVGGWFGPGGWSRQICENFEHKSFMNDGLGGNTGEQGTVLRYVRKSKLFDQLLEPVTDCLHKLKYVGYCDINAMVDEKGLAWPLEFTMRLGNPTFAIQQALHEGDPALWMLDLLNGLDTLKVSKETAVGVVMTHGDYPHGKKPHKSVEGFPIYGITTGNRPSLHFSAVMDGIAPAGVGGTVEDVAIEVTAGDYVLIATGTGATVREARRAAYRTAWGVSWPSNVMFRTDIGARLKRDLPLLQTHGYLAGMEY